MISVQQQIDSMVPRGERLCAQAIGKKFAVRKDGYTVTGTIVEARVGRWDSYWTRGGKRAVSGIFEVVIDNGLGKHRFNVKTLPV